MCDIEKRTPAGGGHNAFICPVSCGPLKMIGTPAEIACCLRFAIHTWGICGNLSDALRPSDRARGNTRVE